NSIHAGETSISQTTHAGETQKFVEALSSIQISLAFRPVLH
ncbi:hypothetical protein BVRB_017100, partial [Beta vulgaris subsp. vulgaris]